MSDSDTSMGGGMAHLKQVRNIRAHTVFIDISFLLFALSSHRNISAVAA